MISEADLPKDLAFVLQILILQLRKIAVGFEDAVDLLVELDCVADNEGVEDFSGAGELAVDVLVEEGIVVFEDGQEGEEAVVAPPVPDLD